MNFDVYLPFKRKTDGRWCPGVKPNPMTWDDILKICASDHVRECCERYQNGDVEAKKQLQAVCYTGKCHSELRRDDEMIPTQFVMVDIDHCKDMNTLGDLLKDIMAHEKEELLFLAHKTPSGKGMRLVFRAVNTEYVTLSGYMQHLNEMFHFDSYGKFDPAVKNLGRLSFLVPTDYILYQNRELLDMDFTNEPISTAGASIKATEEKKAEKPAELFEGVGVNVFTNDELQEFEAFRYRGYKIKQIVSDYVEYFGEPGQGERHNYYNDMVKNFRCITDNNKRLLLWALPSFDHSSDERWSQIVSICRVNTLSRLPRSFYFFLKEKGYYETRRKAVSDVEEYLLEENEEKDSNVLPPYMPPVFREFLGCCPPDFVLPTVNALLPIMGTLTSYLRAIYPYDNREHSTSFFSVIYAPAGTGKGFVERYIDTLFEDLKMRDFVSSERENLYLQVLSRKGANDKAPEAPHVSLRIIPPKNSEAEFLQKQRDNNGFHMFTFAAEMDSWAKGVKAAGGNKDDMIRIAWDNGEYGQQFKTANTFKGMVRLYWNVLITGTIQQVENYFKNVENGLVTRCSFTSIDNQEFSMPPTWKKMTQRGIDCVRKFMTRCDQRTYASPCDVDIFEITQYDIEEFDKEVDWHFKFKEKMVVDMSWIMPTINAFHKREMNAAALDVDRARDVFRRRVAVRGFRLALMCYGLWEKPRPSDLEQCCKFVEWWMKKDLESMLKLWGDKYNESTETITKRYQRDVYEKLGKEFTRADLLSLCLKLGIRTQVRRIIFEWKRLGYIDQLSKESFKKKEVNK